MKRLMNFLRGMVLLRVNGPFPERFLNLCAQEQVDFWALEWPGQTAIRLTVRRCCLGRALALARRAGETLEAGAVLFSREYGLLCGTENAEALLHYIKEG